MNTNIYLKIASQFKGLHLSYLNMPWNNMLMVLSQFEAERKSIFCSKWKIVKLQFSLLYSDLNQSFGYQLLKTTWIWFIIWKIEHAKKLCYLENKTVHGFLLVLSRLMRKNPPKNAQFLANFSFLSPVNESKISKILFILSFLVGKENPF